MAVNSMSSNNSVNPVNTVNPQIATFATARAKVQVEQKAQPLKQTEDANLKNKKKISKGKIAMYAAIGLVVATALAALTLFAARRINVKIAQNRAKGIQTEAEKLRKELVELFKAGGMKDEKQVAIIKEGESATQKIMEELRDNKLTRKSIFENEELVSVNILNKRGEEDIYEYSNGTLTRYIKGQKKLEDGSTRYARQMEFKNRELSRYCIGQQFKNDITKFKGILNFENGKLHSYERKVESDKNGRKVCSKMLTYDDGRLVKYYKHLEGNPDGTCVAKKMIEYEKGEPLHNIRALIMSFVRND